MSQPDRYPLPSEQEFDLLFERYIVVPGVLWAVAILAAVVVTSMQPAAAPAEMVTPTEQLDTTVVGA